MYKEYFSTRFSRKYKNLTKQSLAALHETMDEILEDPRVGIEKSGDLSSLFIAKFKVGKQQWLLGYTFNATKKKLTWEAMGPHENFYHDLKKD